MKKTLEYLEVILTAAARWVLPMFKCRFPVEIILIYVRWYCKYGLSYRDLWLR